MSEVRETVVEMLSRQHRVGRSRRQRVHGQRKLNEEQPRGGFLTGPMWILASSVLIIGRDEKSPVSPEVVENAMGVKDAGIAASLRLNERFSQTRAPWLSLVLHTVAITGEHAQRHIYSLEHAISYPALSRVHGIFSHHCLCLRLREPSEALSSSVSHTTTNSIVTDLADIDFQSWGDGLNW